MESVAHGIVLFAEIYLGLGLFFAIAFVTRGVRPIDPAAVGTGWGFRLIILPGVIAFWPLLLLRWVRGAPPPEECNAHRDLARRSGR